MLSKAMDIAELTQHPWVLWPGAFIFVTVLAFNLVGDGLRDAFDPKLRKRE
jgi:peptide/nickel transport system permease protein